MERVVFIGTPDFAVPSLEALQSRYEVTLVVTQPDRPAGRRRAVREPEVKVAARKLGLPIFQPDTLRSAEAMATLQAARPDVIVVAAFGEILRENVLSLPPRGCLNVHASLLPRHRGASPVAAAILAGDEVTGVTVMLMDAGMDTGAILSQAEEPIRADDTTESLTQRLSLAGARLLVETLPRWLRGELAPTPQDSRRSTYAPLVRKDDGLIDWTDPAVAIERAIRAFTPWPGAYTYWQGRRLRLMQAEARPDWCGAEEPGTVLEACGGVVVATGEGALLLQQLQVEGKRCVDCTAFLCGQRGFVGSILTSAAGEA